VTATEELVEQRWTMLLEGRCPRCEAILAPADEDTGKINVKHQEGCEMEDGFLERQAIEREGKVLVMMSYSVDRDGSEYTIFGPAIALMPDVVKRHIARNNIDLT